MRRKKETKKPYAFTATKKPFTMGLGEGQVDSHSDGSYYGRFTKPVLVKKGDCFMWDGRRGFTLNGKPCPVKCYPKKKMVYKIAWAAKKIRLAVYPEGRHWIAADTRSYNVSQGSDALSAIRNLISTLQFEDLMQQKEEKRGHKVVRWHVERTPGTKAEMLKMEERALEHGLLLDGVEWKK